MKSDKLLKLNRIALLVLIATFILWSILLGVSIEHDQANDDIFGASLTVEIGFIFLFTVLTEELCVYFAMRYFLQDAAKRSRWKTVLHIFLLIVCVFLIVFQLIVLL